MIRTALVILLPWLLLQAAGVQEKVNYNFVPAVISARAPFYPQAAWAKGIQGKTVLMVTVDVNGDTKVAVKSCGDPLLCTAALQNFRTWRFNFGQSGQFTLTYTFKIGGTSTGGFMGSPKIVMDLPTSVTITMPKEVSALYE